MMATIAAMITLLFGGFLVAASEQDLDNCTPKSVDECYHHYSYLIRDPYILASSDGQYNEDLYKRTCSDIKAKHPCHLELQNCSEEVKSSLRQREKGYEAARAIVCEETLFKDFGMAYLCIELEKLHRCLEQHRPAVDPEQPLPPVVNPFCELYEGEIKCYEQAFNSSCKIPLERAKPAFIRTYNAMAWLTNCKEAPEDPSNPHSSAAFLQPELALGVLSLTLLLQRVMTP